MTAAAQSWWQRRATRETDGAVWLALLLGILLLMPNVPPRPVTLIYLLMMATALGVALRFRVGLIAALILLAAGAGMRVALFGTAYSDVLRVTVAAINLVQGGGDPYGLGYTTTTPPGAPFAYGPLALLWYLPFLREPRIAEMAAAMLILIALAVRGRPVGLALYALTPILVTTAGDGSNDTSAGLLLLIALVVAARLPRAGALLLAVVVAFKPYAAAWVPGLWAWAGGGALLAFIAGFALTWGPALLIWGTGNVLQSFALAEQIHHTSYYSLAAVVEAIFKRRFSPEGFGQLRLFIGAVVALVSLPLVRSAGAMIASGSLIYLATLYAGYWSTHAYIAAIAPIVCWHLDDWVGLGRQRIQWPGDPVGRLEAAADARWPARDGRQDGWGPIARWLGQGQAET